MDKERLKFEAAKWGKRAAMASMLGITGTAILIGYNLYKMSKGLDEIDWDNIKL